MDSESEKLERGKASGGEEVRATLDQLEHKPVLSYVNPRLLTFDTEGGCAVLSLACPFLFVFAGLIPPWSDSKELLLAATVVLGPVMNVVGIWLAYPAFWKRLCPTYQRLLGGAGLALNAGALFLFGFIAYLNR